MGDSAPGGDGSGEDAPRPRRGGPQVSQADLTAAASRHREADAARRRAALLGLVQSGMALRDALLHPDVERSYDAYRTWRKRDRDWAHSMTAALRAQHHTEAGTWAGDFPTFRQLFLRRESPWFHNLIADALEHGEPGGVTLILVPPEHAKTAVCEDFDNYLLAKDPTARVLVGCERQDHAKKILRTVRNRMVAGNGFDSYIERFGPFAPPTGERHDGQPWGATYFDVRKKPRGEERDYSMEALGVGSSPIGSRTTLLQIDDPQSRKSLARTEEYFATIRQDWLSRPGVSGRTVIVMTRVGEDDLAWRFIESGMVTRLIKIPAYIDRELAAAKGWPEGWLWPEKFVAAGQNPDEAYERLRKIAGPDGWERMYMQRGVRSAEQPFDEQMKQRCTNTLRSCWHDPKPLDGIRPAQLVVTVDPGYGRNVVAAFQLTGEKLYYLHHIVGVDYSRTEQIMGDVEEMLHRFVRPGEMECSDVVIETKAFQKGLAEDSRLFELRDRFGFAVRPHDTGANKYDEIIGVPQMALAMQRGEFDFPYMDGSSVTLTDEVWSELFRWRPFKRGTKLRQDLVMTLWFAFIVWRQRRNYLRELARHGGVHQTIRHAALPWKPTPVLVGGHVR